MYCFQRIQCVSRSYRTIDPPIFFPAKLLKLHDYIDIPLLILQFVSCLLLLLLQCENCICCLSPLAVPCFMPGIGPQGTAPFSSTNVETKNVCPIAYNVFGLCVRCLCALARVSASNDAKPVLCVCVADYQPRNLILKTKQKK